MKNAAEMREILEMLLLESEEAERQVADVKTFEAAGVLSRNAGLVVSDYSGNEYRITIVQSE